MMNRESETGANLSHYRILSKLGAGGMGEVYRAHDTRLNREVAIKVLPEGFAQDAERLARFQREAQVLASLNHPNIASIYGLEESGALVMELVEGPTLTDLIAADPLPLEEILPIARQIAEALEAAHERGIIHRDLKPANIKVTPEGSVKVLDFGLAKVFEEQPSKNDLSHSPTLMHGTQAGVILGTAAYMSPEQAKGKAVDKRADIWAFGCVLYEMLTGKQAFSGETLTDTLAAVVRADPEWNALPAATPGVIRKLLGRCLTKDPRQRLRDIGEARVAVEMMPEQEEVKAITVTKPVGVRRRFWVGVAGGVAAAAVLAAALAYLMWPQAADTPVRRFRLNTNVPVSTVRTFSISPDGGKVLFIEEGKLKVWELSQLQPRVIEGAGILVAAGEGSAGPFWSPDGKSIAFVRDGSLLRIPSADGQATIVCRLPGVYRGGAWGARDVILLAITRGPMYKVSASGGDPEVFIKLNAEVDVDFHQPAFLPDGQTIVYSLHRYEGVDTIEAYRDGRRKVLLRLEGQARNGPQVINGPQYSPTGHLVYRREQGNPGLWAAAFSPSALEVTGEPFLVAANANNASVADDGTLIFDVDADSGPGQLASVNRKGVVEAVIGEPQENMRNPSLSPDGSRIAYAADEKDKSDIWVVDTRTQARTRLTFSAEENTNPKWSADGRKIIFHSATKNGDAICERSADGTGETKTLAEKGEEGDISPDGRRLIYTSSGEMGRGLRVLTLDGSAPPQIFLEKATALTGSRISPEGRYVAYESWEGGRPGIYIRPFPQGEGQWEVAANQATNPRWNPRGGELFYLDNSGPHTRVMVVPVETKGQLTLGQARELFSLEGVGATTFDFNAMDVSADTRRFIVVKPLSQSRRQGTIIVAQNWFLEFKDQQKR
jgi:Tol biopolymer transport system component